MRILPCHQGDPAWRAARATYYRTASRAPAMMGASKYQSRNDLLRELATGVTAEIDADTQALFDSGHAAEEKARKIVEAHLRKQYGHVPLLPLTCLTDDEYLLASFDGINEDKFIGWECKLWNNDLTEQVKAKTLDPHYYWQLEQQAVVGGLEYIIFTCSDGTPERTVHFKYVPVPGRREALLAGWKQFDTDLAAFQYVEVLPPATAAPIMTLPALSIQVNGAITLTDNLELFGQKLTAFIEALPKAPATDQEFADAEQAIKTLETAQEALERAESTALAQVASVDEMRRTVALYAGQARSTRLMLTKLVAARKEAIRVEIVQSGRIALDIHVAALNTRLRGNHMPAIPADFGGVIKGKKTIASLQSAVDDELARAKIEASATADRIELNLIELRERGKGFEFLFADLPTLIAKAPDDLVNLIKLRIADHQAIEAKRLEAERERIRAEEQAKAKQEADVKAAAERKAEQDAIEAKTRQERGEREAEDRRIEKQRAEAAELERRERLRLDGIKRAEEALQREALDTEQLIIALYDRIKADTRYAKIAKAIDAYLEKQKKVA